MWQVFSNLIKNSLDAIQERRKQVGNDEENPKIGKILITTKATDSEVIISFWDNGVGISAFSRQCGNY